MGKLMGKLFVLVQEIRVMEKEVCLLCQCEMHSILTGG